GRTDVARGRIRAGRAEGGGSGEGLGHGERRVLPVPRRRRGRGGRRRDGRDPPRGFDPGRGGARDGRDPRDGRRRDRASTLPALSEAVPPAGYVPGPAVGV